MKIVFVVGARPNFVKAAPVIRAFKKTTDHECILLHTGQHFDDNMSKIFFQQLEIDNSDYNYFSLAPLVGYQIIIGSTRVNLIGSFPLISISGKNYGKLSGFGINTGIYF